MIDLREAPAAAHHRPGELPGELLVLPRERPELVWIADHEPRLAVGFEELAEAGPDLER
ncbi:hypothetical protein KSP35_05140 [Aquihabitans sp. G128]|uniref:hypothetical protein n=1 Tax=Aquihabitans sp. G128 TaxID=2849779 RepID=UPI001C2426CA|nr:hypothetical protein [Aquihabitans sp. G128]QXC62196.1 hypothetical protein KSP35_05140 [Aquihabitans sp. G128]